MIVDAVAGTGVTPSLPAVCFGSQIASCPFGAAVGGTAMSDRPIRRSFDWPALVAMAVAVVALLGIVLIIH
jgi:hypothetical protein